MDILTESRRLDPPPVVHTAALLWLAAVAFGAFETVLVVTRELLEGAAPGGLLPQVLFRLAIFTGAVFLALRLRHGRNWARWTLAVALGVFGTLSMVLEPLQWLLAGGDVAAATAAWSAWDWAFAASRALHVTAVLGAVTLMFQPRANAYYASA
ncbi:hypothetical protein MF672_006910 [Actinomadura sp. ATCC 31491]|uniref:DUF4149 domain-containing protein n=1 Tax=Actinomadura luzonensis TaxID=2805427 RepID=A0ABT0FMQ2_9ACTN|nr:hypothetical protein [Actinomadura luzonensis]MCK2213524.1 hypothetical protein [Actinomadura luzonensis]